MCGNANQAPGWAQAKSPPFTGKTWFSALRQLLQQAGSAKQLPLRSSFRIWMSCGGIGSKIGCWFCLAGVAQWMSVDLWTRVNYELDHQCKVAGSSRTMIIYYWCFSLLIPSLKSIFLIGCWSQRPMYLSTTQKENFRKGRSGKKFFIIVKLTNHSSVSRILRTVIRSCLWKIKPFS